MPSVHKVTRLAKALRLLVLALIVLIPLGVLLPPLAGWFTPDWVASRYQTVALPPVFSGWQVAGLTLVAMIPAGGVLYALIALHRLLTFYTQGDRLSPECAQAIRHIGLGLLAVAVAGILVHPLGVLIATALNPEGQRAVAVMVSSSDVAAFLSGAVVILIGWVMGEAARIAEDNRAII